MLWPNAQEVRIKQNWENDLFSIQKQLVQMFITLYVEARLNIKS